MPKTRSPVAEYWQRAKDQKAGRPWYQIGAVQAAAGGTKTAKVLLYDAIGGWFGVTAKKFVKELNELDVDEIQLHINSPGGSVWDGTAIMNALRSHKATVKVTVDGIAASIASVIAMAGDEIVMARGSQMMIHNPSAGVWGQASDLIKVAGILEKMTVNAAEIYTARAGGTPAQWRKAMDAETWYNAAEAVTAGLADRTDDTPADTTGATQQFDLSGYLYPGRDAAPAPYMPAAAAAPAPHAPVSSEPGQPSTRKESDMSDALKAGIRKRLGVTDADATDEVLLGALDEALAEQAESPTITPPAGTVLVEQTALDELRASAALGAAAHQTLVAQRRETLVANAVAEGRIPPARKDHWLAQLAADEEGATQVLNSLAKNTIPVAELGHAGGVDDTAEDSLWNVLYTAKDN